METVHDVSRHVCIQDCRDRACGACPSVRRLAAANSSACIHLVQLLRRRQLWRRRGRLWWWWRQLWWGRHDVLLVWRDGAHGQGLPQQERRLRWRRWRRQQPRLAACIPVERPRPNVCLAARAALTVWFLTRSEQVVHQTGRKVEHSHPSPLRRCQVALNVLNIHAFSALNSSNQRRLHFAVLSSITTKPLSRLFPVDRAVVHPLTLLWSRISVSPYGARIAIERRETRQKGHSRRFASIRRRQRASVAEGGTSGLIDPTLRPISLGAASVNEPQQGQPLWIQL